MAEAQVQTRHPDPAKRGPRIPRWKYEAVKRAILDTVPGLVSAALDPDELAALGSVSWHVTVVKLDLEARRLVERVPGASPQRLRRRAAS